MKTGNSRKVRKEGNDVSMDYFMLVANAAEFGMDVSPTMCPW